MNAPTPKPESTTKVAWEKLLSAKQVAGEFGVDEDSVMRWWHCGLPTGKDIPRELMRRRGFAGYLFLPEIVDFIRAEQARLD